MEGKTDQHSWEEQQIFFCSKCTFFSTQKKYLNRHVNKVHNSARRYTCQLCPLNYKRSDSLSRHVRKKHPKDPVTPHKSFGDGVENQTASEFPLENPVTVKLEFPEDERPFKCGQCESRFKNNTSVGRHTLEIHERQKFECQDCGAMYTQKETLKRHQFVHSIGKTFECTECPSTFHRKVSLKRHLKSHRNNPYKCNFCPARFKKMMFLTPHLTLHSKPSRCCKICAKPFVSNKSLMKHVKTFHRITFNCSTCGASFDSRYILKCHQSRHKYLVDEVDARNEASSSTGINDGYNESGEGFKVARAEVEDGEHVAVNEERRNTPVTPDYQPVLEVISVDKIPSFFCTGLPSCYVVMERLSEGEIERYLEPSSKEDRDSPSDADMSVNHPEEAVASKAVSTVDDLLTDLPDLFPFLDGYRDCEVAFSEIEKSPDKDEWF